MGKITEINKEVICKNCKDPISNKSKSNLCRKCIMLNNTLAGKSSKLKTKTNTRN